MKNSHKEAMNTRNKNMAVMFTILKNDQMAMGLLGFEYWNNICF